MNSINSPAWQGMCLLFIVSDSHLIDFEMPYREFLLHLSNIPELLEHIRVSCTTKRHKDHYYNANRGKLSRPCQFSVIKIKLHALSYTCSITLL